MKEFSINKWHGIVINKVEIEDRLEAYHQEPFYRNNLLQKPNINTSQVPV